MATLRNGIKQLKKIYYIDSAETMIYCHNKNGNEWKNNTE